MKNADMPAIPCELIEQYHIHPSKVPGGTPTILDRNVMGAGLTKREMMAIHALQGLLSGAETNELVVGDERNIAETAVDYADALLAALEGKS